MDTALLIVDFQVDFVLPGALGVPAGDVAARINQLASSDDFELVVCTRDWHPPDHCSFDVNGGPWPVHCVRGTPGAELHPLLDRAPVDLVFDKGTGREESAYSAFEGTELGVILRERGVDAVTVVGLVTDYCVLHTTVGAVQEGFDVSVDTAGIRGVDVEPGDSERALEVMRQAGARLR